MAENSNMISKEAIALADKEFKITLLLLFSLIFVSAVLLGFYAKQTFLGLLPFAGYLYFALLLLPYILFGSQTVISKVSNWVVRSYWRNYIFTFYIVCLSTIFGFFSANFNPTLILKLFFWLGIPIGVLMTCHSSFLGWRGFLAVLLLWIPVELNAFAGLDIVFSKNLSIPAVPFIASGFGLYLFTVVRPTPRIGYSFLFKGKEVQFAFVVFLMLAGVIIPLGITLGFIRFAPESVSIPESLKLMLGIYFLVALPEEILFRGLIQNLITQYFEKQNVKNGKIVALFSASIIFGLAHLNNYSPPSWDYAFLATVAGLFYGFTFLKSSKCTVSALVHCGVNLFWALFFKTTAG